MIAFMNISPRIRYSAIRDCPVAGPVPYRMSFDQAPSSMSCLPFCSLLGDSICTYPVVACLCPNAICDMMMMCAHDGLRAKKGFLS